MLVVYHLQAYKHYMKKDVSLQAAQAQLLQKWVIFGFVPVCICHICVALFQLMTAVCL